MRKLIKAGTAVLTAVIIALSMSVSMFAVSGQNTADAQCPSIVIPGIFQSDTYLNDENGNPMLNSEGEPLSAPFYLDSTKDIVDLCMKNGVADILKTLATQRDKDDKMKNAVAGLVGEILLGKVQSDLNGELINDVGAVTYPISFDKLSQEDQKYILRAIPLDKYVKTAGGQNLYFLSYVSFGNVGKIVDELYALICRVHEETGKKVNLVPISQGGIFSNLLLQRYGADIEGQDGCVFNMIHRIIYVIPALDGAAVLGDIIAYGLLDDTDALYGYMMPSLIEDEYIAYLVNLAMRMLPNDVVNGLLDTIVDHLASEYVCRSTALMALIPSAEYPVVRDKYMTGDEFTVLRAQTDEYYRAQCNSRANILKAREYGAEVFDIVAYNFTMYQICDSWNKVQADGIIHLDSSSMGAYGVAVNTQLPQGYVQRGNRYDTCTDPSHNHVDPYNLIDASTGLLPDHTFYFVNQDHERMGSNDLAIDLACRLLYDDTFKDVYSYPEEYPQFNHGRNGKGFANDCAAMRNYDFTNVDTALAQEMYAAMDEAEVRIADTAMDEADFAAYEAAKDRFYSARQAIYEANYTEEQISENEKNARDDNITKFFTDILAKIFKFYSDILLKYFGGKGYSELLF